MTHSDFTLADAVHITHGDSAAGGLRVAGGRDLIVIIDSMFPGPCDLDPVRHNQKRKANLLAHAEHFHGEHAEVRREIWSDLAEELPGATELVRRLAMFSNRPIVLWTSPNFSDRLTLWWILDCLLESAAELDRFWVADARKTDLEYVDILEYFEMRKPGLSEFFPAELVRTFARRSKVNRHMVRAGAALWKSFVGNSPREFHEACSKRLASFPDLKVETRIFLSYFPELGPLPDSVLRLSEFDQSLLAGLNGDQWLRPIDLFRNFQLMNLRNFMIYDDWTLTKRLREWANHLPARPVILSRREPQGREDATAFSYQITWHGKRIRDYGLETPAEAPLMHLGGCSVYDQNPTWVRRWKGKRSSIEAIQ